MFTNFQKYPVEILWLVHCTALLATIIWQWGDIYLWLWLWLFSGSIGSLQGISKALIRWKSESEEARRELKKWILFWPIFWASSTGFMAWFITAIRLDLLYSEKFSKIAGASLVILWIVIILIVIFKLYPFENDKVIIYTDVE